MLKKLALVFLITMLAGLFLPLFRCSADGKYRVNGTEVEYTGFVPCGKCVKVPGKDFNFGGIDDKIKQNVEENTKQRCGSNTVAEKSQLYIHCQFCHFFVMLNDIINFVLINIVPPLAVLMLVIGGMFFYFGGAKPDLLTRGKTLIKGVVIGLFLVYGAYMIVGFVLTVLGVADVEPLRDVFKNDRIFSIACAIKL